MGFLRLSSLRTRGATSHLCYLICQPLIKFSTTKFAKKTMAVSFVQRRFMSSALQAWAYKLSGFNKLGLMRDDLLYEDADVKEALRRLPKDKMDERNYRILRAVQLNIQKDILPKEQWTKLEEDVLYLQPLLKEVQKERKEREDWNKIY